MRYPAAPIQGQALKQYNTYSIGCNPEEIKSSGGPSNLSVRHYGKLTLQVLSLLLVASGYVLVAEATLQFVFGFAV